MSILKSPYPALPGPLWQLQTLFFLLLTACATPALSPRHTTMFPPGYYVFDCPIVYKRGMALLEPHPQGMKAQLLEGVKGSFEIHIDADNSLRLRNAEMDYPGLKRSFKGTGRWESTGHASGDAESWILNFGFAGRDHRTGPWTLRPATATEIEKHEAKERALQERKRKAGMIE